jgi:N-acetylneuraminate lyase
LLNKLIIPVLIFFTQKNQIDLEANKKYIEMLNESDIKSIILLGTTSEGVLISLEQKIEIITLYSTFLNSDIRIFLTPSVWAIDDFKKLMNMNDSIVDILFLPSSYFNRGEFELMKYMHKLFDGTNKNIYLYHLPKNTMVNFSKMMIKEMIATGLNIKGIKLSHSSLDEIKNFKGIDNFDILYGSDSNIDSAIQNGSDYVVCQNLSGSINALDSNNFQDIANGIRHQIKNTALSKISFLKTVLNNQFNLFNTKVL